MTFNTVVENPARHCDIFSTILYHMVVGVLVSAIIALKEKNTRKRKNFLTIGQLKYLIFPSPQIKPPVHFNLLMVNWKGWEDSQNAYLISRWKIKPQGQGVMKITEKVLFIQLEESEFDC